MLLTTNPCLQLAVLATSLKLLLVPAYRSTDFEVHRNWLAITHSLPIAKWYIEATSEWTLDYPPFFAGFEWALSQLARVVDPAMLVVANLDYASAGTVLFQRFSVMATDIVLLTAAYALARDPLPSLPPLLWSASPPPAQTRGTTAGAAVSYGGVVLYGLVAVNAGLLLVDHVHFQYNGVMLGLLLWSVAAARAGRPLLSGFLFAVLLNMKHLFLYAAPVYFVLLLRHYVLAGAAGRSSSSSTEHGTSSGFIASSKAGGSAAAAARGVTAAAAPATAPGSGGGGASSGKGSDASRRASRGSPGGARRQLSSSFQAAAEEDNGRQVQAAAVAAGGAAAVAAGGGMVAAAARLAVLGTSVVAVFAVSLGPFVAMRQLPQLLRRLFPFGRGLLHSYWAANAWAPYAATDKLLAVVAASPRLARRLGRLGGWLQARAAASGAGGVANMAAGVVGVSRFAVLPQVTPGATAAAVLLSLLPCLAALAVGGGADEPTTNTVNGCRTNSSVGLPYMRRVIARAVSYSFLCGFVFGWHVHEKAVLVALLPLALDAVVSPSGARRFLLLSSAGQVGLMPLLYRDEEYGSKVLIVLSYGVLSYMALAALHGPGRSASSPPGAAGGSKSKSGKGRSRSRRPPPPLVGWCGAGYLAVLVAVEVYCSWVHGRIGGGALARRLPFVPLLLTSLTCSVGVLWVWGEMAVEWAAQAVGACRDLLRA